MTTIAQFKKYAKDNLTPFLEENGFKLLSRYIYVKDGPEDIKFVISPSIHYGENLVIWVVCYTEEMDAGEPEAYRFPKGLPTMVGSELSPDRTISYGTSHLWKVGSEDASKEAIEEIILALKKWAIPFFESVNTRQDLVDKVCRHHRADYQEEIDAILAWRPT
ncbi:hypothetical protein [Gallaecimonas sp. GXIMD4217]|uniref:hypothetical protein n=1 Tax=Gallaecimonas sp. GXIMD4217 TaxID=3131927 RepID=UPI00311ABA8C